MPTEYISPISGLIGALIGVCGTLLTVWLSNNHHRKMQDSQLGHEDRTRFHRERLEAYAAFLNATTEFVEVGTSSSDTTRARIPELNQKVQYSFEVLGIVASGDIVMRARDVRSALGTLISGTASALGAYSEGTNAYYDRRNELISSMRKELGIES